MPGLDTSTNSNALLSSSSGIEDCRSESCLSGLPSGISLTSYKKEGQDYIARGIEGTRQAYSLKYWLYNGL